MNICLLFQASRADTKDQLSDRSRSPAKPTYENSLSFITNENGDVGKNKLNANSVNHHNLNDGNMKPKKYLDNNLTVHPTS